MLLGLLFGVLTISLRVDQVLVGLAITIFGGGLTAFLYRDIFAGQNVGRKRRSAHDLDSRCCSDIPIVGKALFDEQLLFYLAWLLVPVFAFLWRGRGFGLNVRAVGENPFAADAAGVDVVRIRYAAIAIAGGMAGLAGGFLCGGRFEDFPGRHDGRQGFIALAITMVGGWNP